MTGKDTHHIASFLDAIAAERGASENTIAGYLRDLSDFSDWLANKRVPLTSASQSDIEAYLSHLSQQGYARATRARRLSGIRQFYRFAHEEGWQDCNPAIRLKGPGRDNRLPKMLSEDEVDGLLTAARETGREQNRLRNTCLMELLYATGMRVSELVSLPATAARGDPRMLLIRGKGGKERMVPLSEPARMALSAWLKHRDAAVKREATIGRTRSAFLFPSNGKASHLTRHRFYLLIKEFAVAAGIDPAKVTPHTLRHAFATHLLANGADLRAIQTLLGHADIATTEIYTHVLDERLKSLVLDHHPLAKHA
ncbi:MAG: site-specific tyrosine recombinase XerD [Pseudomonadota bacterium]